MVFAIPFSAVGVVMAWLLAYAFIECALMQNWAETPALILKADLKASESSYQALAEYEYQFAGKTYRGSRVSLHGGADNIGTFQQRAYDELKGHETSGQPFRCYVNPDSPEESILYPDLRPEMIAFIDVFILIFGGFGLGVLLGGYIYGREARNRAALTAQYPSQPWFWREAWVTNEILPNGRPWFWLYFMVTCYWILVTAPLFWLLPLALVKGELWSLFPMILPAIGVWLVVDATRSTLFYRSIGDCRFHMTTIPGTIGGTLEGTIETDRQLNGDEFELRLCCEEKVVSDEITKPIELWSDNQVITNEQDSMVGRDGGTVIPVQFEIPGNCRPTADETIQWKLTLTSPSLGHRFKLEFPVPIFSKAQIADAY